MELKENSKNTVKAVNSEGIIVPDHGEGLVSLITKESVKSLALKVDKLIYALAKVSNVMVGIY